MKDDEVNNKDSFEYRGGRSANFSKDAKDHSEGHFRNEHGINSIRISSFITIAIEFDTCSTSPTVVKVTPPTPTHAPTY